MPPIRTGPTPSWRAPVGPPRRPNCELDAWMRTKIVELKTVALWSYRQIHAEYPSIPLSTIKYTVSKAREREKNTSLPRSGRPKVLDEADKEVILQKIREEPRVKYDDLLAAVSNKCKKDSIARLLTVEGLKKWRVMKRPYLREDHAAKRLSWAFKYQGYTKEDWDRVFWSDECSIKRGQGLRPEYTFNRPCYQAELGDVHPTPAKGKQIKQMFWASFSGAHRRTGLIPLITEGLSQSTRGGVDRFVIEDLYRRILPTLLSSTPGAIFQQDNAPSHTAHLVRDYLTELGYEVMDWPPISPDLNPIENLWMLLKQKIYQLRPELLHMRNNDTTLELMIATAQQAWQELDLSILEHLSETMPHRVEAIIKSNGWYTKY